MLNGSGSRYQDADVLIRRPEWLVPLLYEHLLSNLRRAKIQIQAGELEGMSTSVERASAIVMKLIASLDLERGGEIASRLSELYAYLGCEIIAVGHDLDRGTLERLIEMVSGLREAWIAAAGSPAPYLRVGGEPRPRFHLA